jgi:hypothetical protein
MTNVVDRSWDHLKCGMCDGWIYVPVTSQNHNDSTICIHSFCKICFEQSNLRAQIANQKISCPLCKKKIEHVVLDMPKIEEITKIAEIKFTHYCQLLQRDSSSYSRNFPEILKYAVSAKNEDFLLKANYPDYLKFFRLFHLVKLYADYNQYDKCLSLMDKIDQLPDLQKQRDKYRDSTLDEIGRMCYAFHRVTGEEGWVELAEKFCRKMHSKEGFGLFRFLNNHYQSSNQFKKAKSLLLSLKITPRVSSEIAALNQKLKEGEKKVPCSCSLGLESRIKKASRSSCSATFWICSTLLAVFTIAIGYMGYQYRRN